MPGCFRALILHIAASITSSAATQVLQSVSVCKDHLAWIGHQQDLNKEFTGSNFPPCWRRGLKRGSLDPSWWDWRMCGSYQVTLSKMLLGQALNFLTQSCLQTRLVSSSCLGKGPSALVWHLFISWLGYGLGQVCREKGLVKLLCILCHPLSPCRHTLLVSSRRKPHGLQIRAFFCNMHFIICKGKLLQSMGGLAFNLKTEIGRCLSSFSCAGSLALGLVLALLFCMMGSGQVFSCAALQMTSAKTTSIWPVTVPI